jgi:hypothetical protein
MARLVFRIAEVLRVRHARLETGIHTGRIASSPGDRKIASGHDQVPHNPRPLRRRMTP